MNEELIRELVLQILESPKIQALLQNPSTSSKRPKALLLVENWTNHENHLWSWIQRWSKDYVLSMVMRESKSSSLSTRELQGLDCLPQKVRLLSQNEACSVKDWKHILVPDCTADTLAKSALGIQDTPFTELIAWGIREGVPITLSTPNLGLISRTPESYRKMFLEYMNKLRQFGVQILVNPVEYPLQTFNKKLLTDHDAFSIQEHTILQIPQGTIISPLARDTLKRRQIKLRVEREDAL